MFLKEYADIISITKDLVQTVFFIVSSIIALQTYRKANKTLFQPIRTEVFKEQVKILSQILNLFINKQEIDLLKEYYLLSIFGQNLERLECHYYTVYFRDNVNDKSFDDFYISLIKSMPYRLEINQGENMLTFTKEENLFLSPEIIHLLDEIEDWNKFVNKYLYVNEKFPSLISDLNIFINSPLLPTKLVYLLKEFRNTIIENLELMLEVLNKYSQALPRDFLTISYAYNHEQIIEEYKSKYKKLEPDAKEIINYIRQYFSPDDIFKISS